MALPSLKTMKQKQMNEDEVVATNTPDPAIRSAALDQLRESMTGEKKPVAQDFTLLKTKRMKRAGVPYAEVLMDALKSKLGTGV